MLIEIIFFYILIASDVNGSKQGCLINSDICSPSQHCINNGFLGVCAETNKLFKNDVEPLRKANQYNVNSRSDLHLPADEKERLTSIMREVKKFLLLNNIQMSDLTDSEIDHLARAIAALYLEQRNERAKKKLELKTFVNQASIEDLARLVAKNRLDDLERKRFSATGSNSMQDDTKEGTANLDRQIDPLQSETPSRKPVALTSSPGETTTVGKQHDNKSLLIKPAFDQTDVDAPQPGVFQVESRRVDDEFEDSNSSPEKQYDEARPSNIQHAPGSSKSAGDGFAKKTKSSRSSSSKEATYIIVIVVLVVVVFCIVAIALILYCMKSAEARNKLLGVSSSQSGDDYQALCRQLYASKASEKAETAKQPLIQQTSAKRLFSPTFYHSKTSRNSSLSSWSEEPITSTLDISTGHTVLAYMEDHLNNKDRLDREWNELCTYKADGVTTKAAQENPSRNRSQTAVPYDHNRVKLKTVVGSMESDYINASYVIDNDPRSPVYIAAQGPLPSTIHHFWQMIWEQSSVVIVMLTPLMEEGVSQCARYWPDEGSSTYNDYEIHLVSEHIWCDDYLVRSLYLKNLKSGETRTVTQFHFFSWPVAGVPPSSKQLLELRRKVSKCYRGNALSPIVVHCSDGCGRTGSYMLLDLVISRMVKGTSKEIDMAATLEHLRDQRSGPIVSNKKQLEFALACVADEVNAILKVLLQ